jgi:hypothetical protein
MATATMMAMDDGGNDATDDGNSDDGGNGRRQ